MAVTRRVSVILPDDRWCSEGENAFKWAIVERIEALGLIAEIFHDPVVREDGAKMPADLGGDIYAPLPDRNHIGPILDSLRRFAAAL